jgi:hypothetical protein
MLRAGSHVSSASGAGLAPASAMMPCGGWQIGRARTGAPPRRRRHQIILRAQQTPTALPKTQLRETGTSTARGLSQKKRNVCSRRRCIRRMMLLCLRGFGGLV